MKIEYTKVGDYFFPNLALEEKESSDYGKWGMLRREYLENHCAEQYAMLKMQGKLNSHLNEIDRSAREVHEAIMVQLERENPSPEQGTMEWVRWQNSLRAIADEQVLNDLIYS